MSVSLCAQPNDDIAPPNDHYQLRAYDCDFVAWAAGVATKFRDEGRTREETMYLFWSDHKVEIPRYRALMTVVDQVTIQIYTDWKTLDREEIVGLTDKHCSWRIGEWLPTDI